VEPERREYRGRVIELRRPAVVSKAEPELLVDGGPVPYGRLPDGLYFLHDYAYDWTDDLVDLAQRFIDYQSRTDEIRRERPADRGE
jgi:hypothetical protein